MSADLNNVEEFVSACGSLSTKFAELADGIDMFVALSATNELQLRLLAQAKDLDPTLFEALLNGWREGCAHITNALDSTTVAAH